jgi:hypothetical protein
MVASNPLSGLVGSHHRGGAGAAAAWERFELWRIFAKKSLGSDSDTGKPNHKIPALEP